MDAGRRRQRPAIDARGWPVERTPRGQIEPKVAKGLAPSASDRAPRARTGRASASSIPQEPIVVAGGSITGLATALSLAGRGFKVVVLEARADPDAPAGKAISEEAERQIEAANRARAEGDRERALELLERARRLQSKLWGSRGRTIVFDRQSTEALKALGASTASFPPMRYLDFRHRDPEVPRFTMRMGETQGPGGGARLDSAALIYQRDFTHQPLINEVERAQLEAVRTHPNIRIEFDAKVEDRIESDTGVTVRFGEDGGRELRGSMLIVADGGGKHGVAAKLGMRRIERARESLSTIVVEVDPGQSMLRQPGDLAGTAGELTPDGWVGFNTDGRGRVAINVRGKGAAPTKTALAFAEERLPAARWASDPATFEYTIDRLETFVAGSRTFFVGDAAARGSPLFGLGGQYGLLWAQIIADMCERGLDERGAPTDTALRWFERKADEIAEQRLTFETALIDALDRSDDRFQALGVLLSSSSLVPAIDHLRLNYVGGAEAGRGGARPMSAELGIDVSIDLAKLGRATADSATAELFERMGRATLIGGGPIEFLDDGAALHLDRARPLRVDTGLETIDLVDGTISLTQEVGGDWRLSWRNVEIERQDRASRAKQKRVIEALDFEVGPELVNRLLEAAPMIVGNAPALARPIELTAQLRDGPIEIGPMQVGLHGSPEISVTVRKDDDRSTIIDLEFLRGSMTLDNAAELNMKLRPSAGLPRMGRFLQSIPLYGSFVASPMIDLVASSYHVRKARFVLHADGTAQATYDGAFSFRLSRDDIQRLTGSLDSNVIGGLMRQYQERIRSLHLSEARS
jgi:2-polyprenyl-6-methoxyphenol hydroxylase-like FAD-dependent oxidoreductase